MSFNYFSRMYQRCENDKKMVMVFYLTLSEADSEPSIQYFVCKIEKFRHLYNFIKQIKEIMQRILEKENKSNDLADKVSEGCLIIFGVIGKITDKDHLLFPKGNAGFLPKKTY